MEEKTMAELFEKLFLAESQEDLDKFFGKRDERERDKEMADDGHKNED